MRGVIIHYNSGDGRGLISDGNRQYPFAVADWQSPMAPTVNSTVEFEAAEDRAARVTRVSDDVLLREKAEALAGRLASLTGPHGSATGNPVARLVEHLGPRTIAAYAAFAVSALLLSFVRLDMMGDFSRELTLLASASDGVMPGLRFGNVALVWAALLSPLAPLAWKSRWSWCALFLPLASIALAFLDMRGSLGAASGGGAMDAYAAAMAQQLAAMMHLGLGAWLGGAAALYLAAVGARRTLLSPA